MKKSHNENLTDISASKFLGKVVEGSEVYNPALLVRVPRIENRQLYGISADNLPFDGFDVWHAYEFSALCKNGLPVTRLLKLKYSCNSDFIVESKSLKLYLNSFNMTKIGSDICDCLIVCKSMIENDLSNLLNTPVKVNFLPETAKRFDIFSNFKNLIGFIDESSVSIKNFKESPNLIKTEDLKSEKEYCLMYDSLRSNCRVTHQPDFGDVFIYYKSHKHIIEASLIEYLVSFRKEYHFHEECCEMIYKRLFDILNEGDDLFVCALYTRRGGIDISPVRYSKNCNINDIQKLVDLSCFARYGIKQ